jgi:hypothetical protein
VAGVVPVDLLDFLIEHVVLDGNEVGLDLALTEQHVADEGARQDSLEFRAALLVMRLESGKDAVHFVAGAGQRGSRNIRLPVFTWAGGMELDLRVDVASGLAEIALGRNAADALGGEIDGDE